MFVVLSTGFAYYNRMLVNFDENGKQCGATEVRELLCKTGFYSKAVETSNHFCMFSSKDCSTCSPRSGLLTSETKKDMKCIDLSKLCLE